MDKKIKRIVEIVEIIDKIGDLDCSIEQEIDYYIWNCYGSYRNYIYKTFVKDKLDIEKLSDEDFLILCKYLEIEFIGIELELNNIYEKENKFTLTNNDYTTFTSKMLEIVSKKQCPNAKEKWEKWVK